MRFDRLPDEKQEKQLSEEPEYRFDDSDVHRYLTWVGLTLLIMGSAICIGVITIMLRPPLSFDDLPVTGGAVTFGAGTALVGGFMLAIRTRPKLVKIAKRVVYGWCIAIIAIEVVLYFFIRDIPGTLGTLIVAIASSSSIAKMFTHYVEMGRIR
ncbi:MAG: hypothetical protein LKK22_00415 [Olsenella sp.]|jgi:uncharacterized membrane protein YvlD (DUF360 family)|nr:hypothetical protein [Olsenella sp.]